MKPARFLPSAQVFVCTNARGADDPLASGCGAHGPAVFAALKRASQATGGRVWVTATRCLGHCPRGGCAAAVHPSGAQWVDVTVEDAPALMAQARNTQRDDG